MKATKKIVGAACALVAAVALSAGSTFAWFVTNNTVSATGLSVSADTSSTYLLIGGAAQKGESDDLDKVADNIQALVASGGGTSTSFTITSEQASIKPSAPKAAVTSSETAAIYSNWYTASGTSATDGTQKGDAVDLNADTFDTYVIKQTIYLTIVPGTSTTGNISVGFTKEADGSTDTFISTATNAPVTIMLVCGSTKIEYKWNTVQSKHVWSNTVITSGVVETTATQIDIYIYYDGVNSAVTTNNAANLTGEDFGLTFTAA